MLMAKPTSIRLCTEGCGPHCPEITIDIRRTLDKQITISDDFGNQCHMSVAQLKDFVAKARNGEFDHI